MSRATCRESVSKTVRPGVGDDLLERGFVLDGAQVDVAHAKQSGDSVALVGAADRSPPRITFGPKMVRQ